MKKNIALAVIIIFAHPCLIASQKKVIAHSRFEWTDKGTTTLSVNYKDFTLDPAWDSWSSPRRVSSQKEETIKQLLKEAHESCNQLAQINAVPKGFMVTLKSPFYSTPKRYFQEFTIYEDGTTDYRGKTFSKEAFIDESQKYFKALKKTQEDL